MMTGCGSPSEETDDAKMYFSIRTLVVSDDDDEVRKSAGLRMQ